MPRKLSPDRTHLNLSMDTHYYIAQLQEALPEIKAFFEMSTRKVYKQIELSKLFRKHQLTWHIYSDVPIKVFVKHLCENTPMKKIELFFGKSKSRKETRYLWGKASIYEIAFSLKNHSYFTHHTAAHLHGLTENPPKTIYLNSEQSKRPPTNVLSQEAVDMAFRNSVRISNNRAQYQNKTICLLNGMHTGQLGVIESISEKGEKIRLTSIERTLTSFRDEKRCLSIH